MGTVVIPLCLQSYTFFSLAGNLSVPDVVTFGFRLLDLKKDPIAGVFMKSSSEKTFDTAPRS